MPGKIKRRDFLRSGAVAASVGFVPYIYTAKSSAAQKSSDRLRMGAIGVGNMGQGDLDHFNKLADVVAICDVDTEYGLARTRKRGCGRQSGDKIIAPDTCSDYRRILDRKDIDFVQIATPDHWHVKIAIEAMQAGKHVFCEKPLTLTLEENLLIRKAVHKYGKVLQVGTMQRCFRNEFMLAALIVRGGHLGQIKRVTCDVGGGPSCAALPIAAVPASLDWNQWLGPAPWTDYLATSSQTKYGWPTATRGHFNFRWWYEYSGGKFTDWGAHHIDCALWALGLQSKGTGPVWVDGTDSENAIEFSHGRPVVSNQYNTAIRFNIVHHFASGLELIVTSKSQDGSGILFEGTNGRMHVSRGRIKGKIMEDSIAKKFEEKDYIALNNGAPFDDFANMKGQEKAYHENKFNFLYCIQHGGTPICDVDTHVLAAHLCHLSGIAARLKRRISWDSQNERIVGDEEAASFFGRPSRKEFAMPQV
ncbi:MAG: Gfo/Idh/MocA family oxidoreductase [Thermoguttaceae bacterium]|nr:Gfo/Idh/MocA family oxidoreductase [Thermoguttaceae bacterium]